MCLVLWVHKPVAVRKQQSQLLTQTMVRQHAGEFYTSFEGRFESCSAHHSADSIPIPKGSSPGHRRGRNEWSDGDVVIQMEWITWTPLHTCNDPVWGNCNVVFPPGLRGNSTPDHSGAQIKCFSLSEDFLSPVAFSINSSQTDKRLPIGLDTFYHSSYSPAGMALPGLQIR